MALSIEEARAHADRELELRAAVLHEKRAELNAHLASAREA